MKSASKYSLQRTMIVYFLLIGFASLLVGIEFIVETHGSELRDAILSNLEKHSEGKIGPDAVFAPIDKLRSKAILMIVIIMCVMLIVLTMFIKNITGPLQHMIDLSKKISKGDLSQTITVRSDNELAELGNVINEMSSNLQEIILLSKNMCASGQDFITKTSDILNQRESLGEAEIQKLGAETEHLRSEIEMLTEVIEYFNFYTLEK